MSLVINGIEYHRKDSQQSTPKITLPKRVPLPKGWSIPEYWIVRLNQSCGHDFHSAYRTDGVYVGRNGVYFYTHPVKVAQTGSFRTLEEAIYTAEKAFPFPLAEVTWPRLVWIKPLGEEHLSMAYALLYAYEKKKNGLYELDCLRTVQEQTYDTHCSDHPQSKMWGPEAQWKAQREKVLGTIDHLFVGEHRLEPEGHIRKYCHIFSRVPSNTRSLLQDHSN